MLKDREGIITRINGPVVDILFNNLDAIESALKYAADAEKQIKVLELELADAERELDEATKKTTHKKTKATADANE